MTDCDQAHTTLVIDTADSMQRLGACLAARARPASSIWLQGELGTGKTTLCRGFLRALGYRGRVKSPTFTLIESYPSQRFTVHHMDFYRIRDAAEIEGAGLRDYFDDAGVCLIEWPERAQGRVPAPVLRVVLTFDDVRRRAALYPRDPRGDFSMDGLLEAFRAVAAASAAAPEAGA